MKTLLTFIATLFAFTAFAQGPVLRTPYTVNTADVVTNIVRHVATNSTIHAGKLAPGGTLPALNGSAVTNLNGTFIASGTVADARLSANVPLKDGNQTFSGNNTFSGQNIFTDIFGTDASGSWLGETLDGDNVGVVRLGLLGTNIEIEYGLESSTNEMRFMVNNVVVGGINSNGFYGNGVQLSNIAGGSGITAAQLQPNLTNLISLVDGTKVARSNLVIFTMGDSRWLSGRAIKALTNLPAWKGVKAFVHIVDEGGGGIVYATNSWITNGLIQYSNTVAAGDVPIMIDHCSINDSINGFMSNDTNGGAFYYSVKTNFYASQLIPLGFKIFVATIDATFNNSDPSNGSTDEGFFTYNNLQRTRTNFTAGIVELQLRTPNYLNADIYSDGTHLTDYGYAEWADQISHDLQFGANRIWISSYRAGTNWITRGVDGTLIDCIEDSGWRSTPLKSHAGSVVQMVSGGIQSSPSQRVLAEVDYSGDNAVWSLNYSPALGIPGQLLAYFNAKGSLIIEGGNGHLRVGGGRAIIAGQNDVDYHFQSVAITGGGNYGTISNATHGIGIINWASNGVVQIPNLAGGGNQTVLVDDNGVLSAGAGGSASLNHVLTALSTNNAQGTLTNVPRAGVNGLEVALDFLTNNIGGGSASWSEAGGVYLPLSALPLVVTNRVELTNGTAGVSNVISPNGWTAMSGRETNGGATMNGNQVFVTDNSFSIGLASSGRPRDIYAANEVVSALGVVASGNNGYFQIGAGARGYIDSPSAGVFRLGASVGTDSGLNLGGNTASFPSLRRSSAVLAARLADDSAATDLTVLDEAYDEAAWNASLEVPTKNAMRDKIESMSAGGGTNAYYSNTDPDQKIVAGGDNNFLQWYNSVGARTGFLDENSNLQVQGNLTVAGGSLVVTNQAEPGTDYELAVVDENGTFVRDPGTGIAIAVLNATTINGGSSSIKTNTAAFDVDITAFVVGTRYTNSTRRSFVTASFTLNGAAAGTAAVTLSAEQAGVTNMVKISAGPLASLSTIEQLSLLVGPGAFYYFTDATTGTGASVAIVTGTSSRADW